LTPLSIFLILISAIFHSSWNFFSKKGNWPLEFYWWVFLWGAVLFGALMGVLLLKESHWKTRIIGASLLTLGLLLIGLAK